MKEIRRKELLAGIILLATFALWTVLIRHMITDWLGLVPIIICMCFGVLGLVQLIKRRSILRVDPDILLLGIYYVLVIACYLIFEMIPINYRPILINGNLEASYPSSTTDRQTDFRRPLGNGYYWLRFPEFRSVYGLSIHGRIYWVQKKHLTAEA